MINTNKARTFRDNNLLPFVIYSYKVQSFNDQGNTTSRTSLISIILPTKPCCTFEYSIPNIRPTQIDVAWSIPEKLNGLDLIYFVSVYRKINITRPLIISNIVEQTSSSVQLKHNDLVKLSSNGYLEAKIESLIAYTQYLITIKACNRDLKTPDLFYCLNGLPKSNTSVTLGNDSFIQFVTSQDRPENQQPPLLISLNSSYVVIGVLRPKLPNGIILLYEIWIKTLKVGVNGTADLNTSLSDSKNQNLACAIEDLYDPNDINSFSADPKPKICIIKNLKPNTAYALTVSSSNFIGRSVFSSELRFITLENLPKCAPRIVLASSNISDTIYFSWLPSYNMSVYDPQWQNCIGGVLKNFTLYEVTDGDKLNIIYSDLENNLMLEKLNFSTKYKFKLELCNGVGCASTDVFEVTTIDPPPNSWGSYLPAYKLVNTSHIRFDWSAYNPFNFSNVMDKLQSVTYKLERAEISFAYPPSPLESGIRFHGFNFYSFSPSVYFPEGYPYFGFKYSFRTSIESSLVYFAASSFAQNELVVVQNLRGSPWLLSNTLSNDLDSCSIYLNSSSTPPFKKYNDDKWYSMKTFRINSFAYLRVENSLGQTNSSLCKNQVLTDLTGIFVGGLPDNFLSRDESQYVRTDYKQVQRRRFIGCLKNLSTILGVEDVKLSNSTFPKLSVVNMDFDKAVYAPGESQGSNTIYGCPVNLETANNTIYLLSFGFLYVNLRQTMPIIYQTNKYLSIDLDLRTEWSQGLIFFNFDIDNDQFVLVRLLDSDFIEINFRTRVKYEDPQSTDKSVSNYFDLNIRESAYLKNLSSGYWSNINIRFDFINQTLQLDYNKTRTLFVKLITSSSVSPDIINKTSSFNLLFTFYTDVQYFMGGYNISKISANLRALSVPWITPVTRLYFTNIFNLIQSLDDKLYFSGCIRNFKLNTFTIDYSNLNNIFNYRNVRFDGCPNLNYFNLKRELKISKAPLKISTIYEGESNVAYDFSFNSFTEYFYRVVAINSQGRTNSDWFLVRSPDSIPTEPVDLKYLKAAAISGYKILVENMVDYCFYCENKSKLSGIFSGIVKNFILTVKEYNTSTNIYETIRNYTFYCDNVCVQPATNSSVNDPYENFFTEEKDSDAIRLLVDTNPITKYSLTVSVCNSAGCTESSPVSIVTLEEAPDGVYSPTLLDKSSSSLHLGWNIPKYPSGIITGYILRQVSGNVESVIYFGLRTDYQASNLKPLSNYSFSLEACNSKGCGRSKVVSFLTGEMAPISVSQPILVNLTETVITLKWNKPTNDQLMSGFLIGYILYVSQKQYEYNVMYNASTCTECASNVQVLSGLIPGSEYIIHLSACTNGGCTNSSELRVTTLESVPFVDDIVIKAKERTSSSILIEWNAPSRPNGRINKYILYKDEQKVYEGLSNNFTLAGLSPNSYFSFFIVFCNYFYCNSTKNKTTSLSTEESEPQGAIILEAQAASSNQIQLKWYTDPKNPLVPNGIILFSVYVSGPFLIEYTKAQAVEFKKLNLPFTTVKDLNLLNTTIYNTKYGIFDRILPYSNYTVRVNANNTKGYIMSNQVRVETFKSTPDLLIPPQLVEAKSRYMKIEWYDPILINSEDKTVYFQVDYKVKYLWNTNGSIPNAKFESQTRTIFTTRTLATTYILNDLVPYTAFSFQLIASNTYGQSKSDWSDQYYTKEEPPVSQEKPKIVNYTSNSVFINWVAPKIPNGWILFYRILIFKYTNTTDLAENPLRYAKNITITELNKKEYNITDLDSYEYYLIEIESCNSVGCASSYAESNNYTLFKNFIRTEATSPDQFDNPALESLNSFSVEVKWRAPAKPNGVILNYVLERMDYTLPLSLQIKNSTNNTMPKITKYKFDSDKFKFVDYENLESCGLYSYRLIASNQIGNASTQWVNVTIKPSKPLIVTPPIVNLIDSETARFEWMLPLTYCPIKTYSILLKPSNDPAFQVDIDNRNATRQSAIVKKLTPYTVYSVTLVACVYIDYDACTPSLTKSFRTLGTVPGLKGLSTPLARLVSAKAISIEWLEPTLRNGQTIDYQLIRLTRKSSTNKTETVYFGNDNYFLDTTIKNSSVYSYRVVYSNEFGNSISEWSNEILTESIIDPDSTLPSNQTSKIIKIIFSLSSNVLSPTALELKWRTYSKTEILNFIKLYDSDINMNQFSSVLLYNITISNATVLIKNMNNDSSEFELLLSNKANANEVDAKLIKNLIPSTSYELRLNLYFTLEVVNKTKNDSVMNRKAYKFISERVVSDTMSVKAAYGDFYLKLASSTANSIRVGYNLSNTITKNYDIYQMNLNRSSEDGTQTSLVDSKKFVNSNGSLTFAQITANLVYLIYIRACSENSDTNYYLYAPFLFLTNNCIDSDPIYYSTSTEPPANISDIYLKSISSNKAELEWRPPGIPNDFKVNYLLYKRNKCYFDFESKECSSKDMPDEVCCSGYNYKKKFGYECCDTAYLQRPNYAVSCCGGKFYKTLAGYECCAGFYVSVPDGQKCCSYYPQNEDDLKEIRISVGFGDSCCLDTPYSSKRAQTCCRGRLVSAKIANPVLKTAPINNGAQLFDEYKCPASFYGTNSEQCLAFGLISNQTQLNYSDSQLESYTYYDYKLCAQNSFASSCNNKVLTLLSNMSLPQNFSFFNYEILGASQIYLYWRYPLYLNGPVEFYKLFRNDAEIYKGLSSFFYDETVQIQPFQVYKYEVQFCNEYGCISNDNKLVVSTKDRLPEQFELYDFKVLNSTIQILWKYPTKPNGLVDKYVLNIKEIDLELIIYFDLKYNDTKFTMSAKDSKDTSSITLTANANFNKSIVYSLTISDLSLNTNYSFRLMCCNKAGCVLHPNTLDPKSKNEFTVVKTGYYLMFDLKNPVIYVIDDTSTEIVWQEPAQKSNIIVSYRLYRNSKLLVDFKVNNKSSNLTYKLGFYSYVDSNLVSNSFYTYKIEAYSQNLSIFSQEVIVQTSPTKFEYKCSSSVETNHMNTVFSSLLPLLDVISINFTVNSSTEVLISYSNQEWKNFISCISRSNYQKMNSLIMEAESLGGVALNQFDKSVFSMKILLESNFNGFQSLDFPYPNEDDETDLEEDYSNFILTGLSPFSNYSIRISFTSSAPNRQILTTKNVYLQTFEQEPCCDLHAPLIQKQSFSRLISVRWKAPQFPNGIIDKYTLIKAKLKGQGCLKYTSDQVSFDESEVVSEFELVPAYDDDIENGFSSEFFYDSTNLDYVYKDKDPILVDTFAYYSYKIVAYNLKGKLESNWTTPILSWQIFKPTPPLDLKITDAYSTGFRVKFKEPLHFNGILSFYTVRVKQFGVSNKSDVVELILEPNKTCKIESYSSNEFIEAQISGLQPFKSYRVTVIATNIAGLNSDESEQIIANTLESVPYNIKSFTAIPFENPDPKNYSQSILFKFEDPEYSNGVITQFNLYLINETNNLKEVDRVFYDNQLGLIYSGLNREFLFSNLKPYKNYSFLYEVCTYIGCTRQASSRSVLTLESSPYGQNDPVLERDLANLNCYKIYWTYPSEPNGKILYFEINKIQKLGENTIIANTSINIPSSNTIEASNFSYVDCDLKPSYKYAYKIVSFNSRGSASSNFSKFVIIGQGVPSGFEPIKVAQLNDTLIRIEWPRPSSPNGQIVAYNVYRDSVLITNSTKIPNFDTAESLAYSDLFDFLPNKIYVYEIEACNEIGCASDAENYAFRIMTNNQPPLFVKAPNLIELSDYGAVISANDCVILKSPITQKIIEYRFYINNSFINRKNMTSLNLNNLAPFTNYAIQLEACTFLTATDPQTGCLLSNETLYFQTNQSAPTALKNIYFKDFILNEFFILVELRWSLPGNPNGILRHFKLIRDGFDIFISSDMSVLSYKDSGLLYGQNYTYELVYYNDVGLVSVKSWHFTQEYLPQGIEKIECMKKSSTEIEVGWMDPLFPNGALKTYEIKFKKLVELEWRTISFTKFIRSNYSLKIGQLTPFTQYEFQIVFCNSIGCSKSNITNDEKCFTLESAPIGILPPECIELSTINSLKIVLLIKWEPPLQPNGIIKEYTLYRITFQSSISYDSNYNYVEVSPMAKTELYTGKNMSFVDSSIEPYSKYDYFVVIKSNTGSTVSPYTRFSTRPIAPMYLKVGEIASITNQSVYLNLKPPLNINGQLLNIFISLLSNNVFKEILIYSNNPLSPVVNGRDLLKLLTNFNLRDLKPSTKYEIKTKFCNQVGCLTSFESIKFETFDNDKLVYFNAIVTATKRIELRWKFKYGNPNEFRPVK